MLSLELNRRLVLILVREDHVVFQNKSILLYQLLKNMRITTLINKQKVLILPKLKIKIIIKIKSLHRRINHIFKNISFLEPKTL